MQRRGNKRRNVVASKAAQPGQMDGSKDRMPTPLSRCRLSHETLQRLPAGKIRFCAQIPVISMAAIDRFLDDVVAIEAVLMEAALRCGATIVSEPLFIALFRQGVSGIVVIANHTFAIHTWPEHGYAAVDLFTCGKDTAPR